jgi:hypothetical protein
MTNTQLEAEIEHLLMIIAELKREINALTIEVNALSSYLAPAIKSNTAKNK